MGTLWQDIKYGVRTLGKNPGFTAVAVLTLALGIGANTTIFSWTNAMLLNPLPGVPRSGDLLEVTFTTIEGRNISFSYPNFEDVRDNTTTLQGLVVHRAKTLNLATSDGPAERLWGEMVSGNFFDVLQVKPILGRTFLPEENEVPSRNPVAVIGYGLWQRTFGGDPQILGKQITLNSHPFTIIGVMAPEFQGPETGLVLDLYVPMMMQHELVPGGDKLKARGSGWLSAKARLKPGVTLKQAQAEMDTIVAQLATDFPDSNEGRGLALYPLWRSPFGAQMVMTPVLLALLGVAGLVLLIACANVANLLLARATSRRKEIALRLALGAQRIRLIRQLLTESLLLSSLGGILAVAAAYWTSGLMGALFPPLDFPIKMQAEVDGTVLVFSLAVSLLTGFIFGLAPALQSTKADLVRALNDESSRGTGSRSKGWLRNTLVVAQVSLSLALLVSAGLFVRSLQKTQTLQPGFTIPDVLLTSVDLFPSNYSREESHTFFRQLLDQTETMPGVEQAALARAVPLSLGGASDGSVRVNGYEPGPNERVWSYFNTVSPNYFRTMEIPLLEGRDFTAQDTDDTELVTIISERMARQYWKNKSPLGQKVRRGGGTDYTVVGVVGDITFRFLNEDPVRVMYFPVFQSNRQGLTLHLKLSGPLGSLPASVRETVRSLDPGLPVFGVQTLERATAAAGIQQKIAGSMIGVFGLLALLLASVGLYGVLAYAVGQRTHEIGIRMALGARQGDILKLVLKQGGLLIGIGTVLGLAGAFGLAQAASSLLYGVSPTDPFIYGGTTLTLIAVSLLACYIPARRATQVDPMVALRYE